MPALGGDGMGGRGVDLFQRLGCITRHSPNSLQPISVAVEIHGAPIRCGGVCGDHCDPALGVGGVLSWIDLLNSNRVVDL